MILLQKLPTMGRRHVPNSKTMVASSTLAQNEERIGSLMIQALPPKQRLHVSIPGRLLQITNPLGDKEPSQEELLLPATNVQGERRQKKLTLHQEK